MSQTRDGGKPVVKDLDYCPPQGPKDQGGQTPGLGSGSTNHGTSGTQGRH